MDVEKICINEVSNDSGRRCGGESPIGDVSPYCTSKLGKDMPHLFISRWLRRTYIVLDISGTVSAVSETEGGY